MAAPCFKHDVNEKVIDSDVQNTFIRISKLLNKTLKVRRKSEACMSIPILKWTFCPNHKLSRVEQWMILTPIWIPYGLQDTFVKVRVKKNFLCWSLNSQFNANGSVVKVFTFILWLRMKILGENFVISKFF